MRKHCSACGGPCIQLEHSNLFEPSNPRGTPATAVPTAAAVPGIIPGKHLSLVSSRLCLFHLYLQAWFLATLFLFCFLEVFVQFCKDTTSTVSCTRRTYTHIRIKHWVLWCFRTVYEQHSSSVGRTMMRPVAFGHTLIRIGTYIPPRRAHHETQQR